MSKLNGGHLPVILPPPAALRPWEPIECFYSASCLLGSSLTGADVFCVASKTENNVPLKSCPFSTKNPAVLLR